MTRILFICHGNICRSPMAEFIMKKMALKRGLLEQFTISSAATSTEELGNPVYPPAREILRSHGIDCGGKRARQVRADDYDKYDMLICMDRHNVINLMRIIKDDPEGKISMLQDYAGRPGDEVADPWFTGNFDETWRDITAGCAGLIDALDKQF